MLRTIVCLFMVHVSTSAFAQSAESSSNSAESPISYIVQLTEYHLEAPLEPSQTATDILKMLSGNRAAENGTAIETLRFSTLSGIESMVQFGRRVNVTSSTTTSSRGPTLRNMQAVDLGSLVRATVVPRKDKVFISLTFESSRIAGDEKKDSLPDIKKTQLKTSQLLVLGKPTLVGSSTSATTSVIVVQVMRD